MISLSCVIVLLTVRPFREETDNSVAISGQALVYLWVYLLLLRIIRVGEGAPTFVGSAVLVVTTIGLFIFAVHAIYAQLRLLKTDESENHNALETELRNRRERAF